ncbi:hypothetical protein HHK36_016835 [Tetracentron sinense]|uniref:Small nuclear ribonucleoprotein G n=1 Tax=Tetracentron sinense TaxID=13715 RepID=A0A834Z079_TETSI|nr:hypothetical protein HHK36_016835 [Tetracentron sinense]
MSRSGQPPDLKKYMDKKLQRLELELCVAVKLNANRMVVGTLRGFDQFMNLVIDNTVEVNGNDRNEIGMVVLSGEIVWSLLKLSSQLAERSNCGSEPPGWLCSSCSNVLSTEPYGWDLNLSIRSQYWDGSNFADWWESWLLCLYVLASIHSPIFGWGKIICDGAALSSSYEIVAVGIIEIDDSGDMVTKVALVLPGGSSISAEAKALQ